MDKKEFGVLAMAIRTSYPREQILVNEKAYEIWFRQLQDIPYKVAETALQIWIATNRWSPTIADIREKAVELTMQEKLDWSKAWEEVRNAIGCYGHRDPQGAYASMSSEITREVVRRIGWNTICFTDNLSVERANFRMIYEELAEKEKKQAQIPEKLRLLIGNPQSVELLADK